MQIVLLSLFIIGILGIIAGGILAFAAKKFAVPVDPRLEELIAVLPGANCGACGYASCRVAAKAILEGEAAINICIAGGKKVLDEVAVVMNVSDQGMEITPQVAVVSCQGSHDVAKDKFVYHGFTSCQASQLVAGGHKTCGYGCLGLGDCVNVCPFGAIVMGQTGLPIINESKCTACGKCVQVCPRHIITIIPRAQEVFLGCISQDKLKKVKEACQVGCIACSLCTKPAFTPEGLISMADNLPVIHWQKDKDLKVLLEKTVAKCPNKCFIVRGK